MKSIIISGFALISLVCLLQVTQTRATLLHAQEVLQYFHRVRVDKTKNAVYRFHVQRGVRKILRNPLLAKTSCLEKDVKLSSDCLNRMVDEARQHENKFYAKFTYACKGHTAYSAACLEAAQPEYYRQLKALASQTVKCWQL